MKLSVSLSDEDVAILDAYVKSAQLPSRSAGLQRAVQMLRHPNLEDAYDQAWSEWAADENSAAWDDTTGDGVADAAR
jgi:Arc/MetJ-type ribon-helix-helix transcriptional regulator